MDEDTFTKTAKNILPTIEEIPEMTESDFEQVNQFFCQDTNGDDAFSEAECTHGFYREKPYTLYHIQYYWFYLLVLAVGGGGAI